MNKQVHIWIVAAVIVFGVSAIAGRETEALADQQDAEALSSREWAGQQVCGRHATAVWDGDVLQCLRNVDTLAGSAL